MTARVLAVGITDVGRKRSHNEDAFAVIDDHHLYVVADGMGGHASGEVASKMAIETLQDFYASTAQDPEATWPYKMDKGKSYEENRLITGIRLANLRIHEAQQRNSKLHGMGTTIVALVPLDEGVLTAHVGDSRIYRLRQGKLEQLTEDHSLINDYIKMKKLTKEEIENFRYKNVIVRALGMKDSVKVDTSIDRPEPGDTYILCSDGLCGPVSDEDIQKIAASTPDIKEAAQKLIDAANAAGGPDNVTVVMVKIIGLG